MGNCMCMGQQTAASGTRGTFSGKRKKRIKTTSFHHHHDDGDTDDLLGASRTTSSSVSGGYYSSGDMRTTEIKIRMTKKDLEDLMRRISLKVLTAEEALSALITDGGDQLGDSDRLLHQRSWKPTLKSIPEID